MLSKTFGVIGIATVALAATAAHAGPGFIIAPTSATVDTSGPGNGSIENTFNQAGLSSNYTPGVTNFDAYIASNPQHTQAFACCEFFGNAGTSTLQVTYDFGSTKMINALALWNEESSGIGKLDLLTSLDGSTFTSLVTGLTPTDNNFSTSYYLADVFAFSKVSTRFVRFEASGCPQPDPGSFPACAIGEVAFRTAAVPEPASWAMMIVGFGLVGVTARRRSGAVAA